MVIKIGDPIPNACDVVDNIPFGMLDGQTGTLQQSADAFVDDKPAESDLRDSYKVVFLTPHKLKVCDDDAEVVFAVKHYPLAVKVKKGKIGPMILLGGDFDHHGARSFAAPPASPLQVPWQINDACIKWMLPRITNGKRLAVCLSNQNTPPESLFSGVKSDFYWSFFYNNPTNPTGWTRQFVNDNVSTDPFALHFPTNWDNFFKDIGPTKFSDVGLLYISSAPRIDFETWPDECHIVLRNHEDKIKAFLEKGGGLISHTQVQYPSDFSTNTYLWKWLTDKMLTGLLSPIEEHFPPGGAPFSLTAIGNRELNPFGITDSIMAPFETGWGLMVPTHNLFTGNYGGLDLWMTVDGLPVVIGGFLDAFPA